MAIHRREVFIAYFYSTDPRNIFQTSPPSPPSSPSSPAKICFLFTRSTLTLIRDGPQDPFLLIWGNDQDPLIPYFSVHAEDVDRGNREFYSSVYESLESLRIQDEDLHGLATSIMKSAYEIKLCQISSNPNFRNLYVNVILMVTDMTTMSDTPTALENAIIESIEEYEEANYGMVPASEEAKRTMLKSITVTREEDSAVKDRCNSHRRRSPRLRLDLIEEERCVICLEDIQVGSHATEIPCSHVFHNTCIEEWLEVSHFCPTCRYEFPIDLSLDD